MDQVMRGLEFVVVYTDEIQVPSSSPRQHETHLRQLFTQLQKYDLSIHPSKCIFRAEMVDVLGHWVRAEGIAPLPQKILAIKEFSRPSIPRRLLWHDQLLPQIHPSCRRFTRTA